MDKQDQIKLLTAFLFGALVNIVTQFLLDTYSFTVEQIGLMVIGIGVVMVYLWKNGGKHP